jgi:uncharacterized protein (UPF0147 family)
MWKSRVLKSYFNKQNAVPQEIRRAVAEFSHALYNFTLTIWLT